MSTITRRPRTSSRLVRVPGYLVVRQEDVWFIKFDGEEYGPYQSEREAMLFAIDAAHKLGEQGEETQVLQMDENGEPGRCGPTGSTLIRLAYKARFGSIVSPVRSWVAGVAAAMT